MEEEARLLHEMILAARKVYMHVKEQCVELHDARCLPKPHVERTRNDQLHYLRRVSRAFELGPSDYQLLAHLPHILGSEVFGHTEACDGGWRWSFQPAGVDLQSAVFPSEKGAAEELAAIQKELYPAWGRQGPTS